MNTTRPMQKHLAAMPFLLALCMLLHAAAGAALTEEQKGQAVTALGGVAQPASPETADALYEMISRGDVSAEEWAPVFREYLDKNHFAPALGGAWRGMVAQGGPGQASAARAAGAFAAAALQSVLQSKQPSLEELDTVLLWLEQCTAFAPPLVATIATGLDAVLRAAPLDSALLAAQQPPVAETAPAETVPPAEAAAPAATTPSDPAMPAPPDPPKVEAPSPAPAPATPAPALPGAAAPTPAPAKAPGIVPAKPLDKDKPKKTGGDSLPPRDFSAPAMQVAITLGYYGGPANIGQWMRLPELTLGIYQSSGVWVFDGGTLAPPQAISLGSLLTALPMSVTGVSAVTLVPLPFALRTQGTVLPLAPVMPELMRPPVLLPGGGMLPAMPEFTAQAVRALCGVIQQRELAKRPELVRRRDVVIMAAQGRTSSVLPAYLSPGGYAGAADFFPALMVLWTADAVTALQSALAASDQGEHDAIYALLLLADLLSGGGDSTLVLAANPAGQVTGAETALRRNFIAPGYGYVTAVAGGGRLFFFDGIAFETLLNL